MKRCEYCGGVSNHGRYCQGERMKRRTNTYPTASDVDFNESVSDVPQHKVGQKPTFDYSKLTELEYAHLLANPSAWKPVGLTGRALEILSEGVKKEMSFIGTPEIDEPKTDMRSRRPDLVKEWMGTGSGLTTVPQEDSLCRYITSLEKRLEEQRVAILELYDREDEPVDMTALASWKFNSINPDGSLNYSLPSEKVGSFYTVSADWNSPIKASGRIFDPEDGDGWVEVITEEEE